MSLHHGAFARGLPLALVLLLLGCSGTPGPGGVDLADAPDGGPDEQVPAGLRPGTFTTNAPTHERFGVVELTPSPATNDATLSGRLGAQPVVLAALGDGRYTLALPPAVSAGTHALQFDTVDVAYRGSITVVEPTDRIDDAAALFAHVEAAFAAELARVRADAALRLDGPELGDVLSALDEAQSVAATAQRDLATLSPSEREWAAYLVREQADVGFELLAGFEQFGKSDCVRDETTVEGRRCLARAFGRAVLAIPVFVQGALASGKLAAAMPSVAPVFVVAGGISLSIAFLRAAEATSIGVKLVKFAVASTWPAEETALEQTTNAFRLGAPLFKSSLAPSVNEFGRGRYVRFGLDAAYRPVQPGDASGPVAWLAEFASAIATYNDALPSAVASRLRIPFAPAAPEFVPADPAHVRVEVVSGGQTITALPVEVVGDEVAIAFDSSSTANSGESFQYDLVYDNGSDPRARIRISATLEPAACPETGGTTACAYALRSASGGALPSPVEFALGTPQTFVLTLADGTPTRFVDYANVGATLSTGTPQLGMARSVQAAGFALSFSFSGAEQPEHMTGTVTVTHEGEFVGTMQVHLAGPPRDPCADGSCAAYTVDLLSTTATPVLLHTLPDGGSLSVPNGRNDWVEWRRDGQRVGDRTRVSWPALFNADDLVTTKELSLVEGGRVTKTLTLNVTIRNDLFRALAGTTRTVRQIRGSVRQDTLRFNADGTYTTATYPNITPPRWTLLTGWMSGASGTCENGTPYTTEHLGSVSLPRTGLTGGSSGMTLLADGSFIFGSDYCREWYVVE